MYLRDICQACRGVEAGFRVPLSDNFEGFFRKCMEILILERRSRTIRSPDSKERLESSEDHRDEETRFRGHTSTGRHRSELRWDRSHRQKGITTSS